MSFCVIGNCSHIHMILAIDQSSIDKEHIREYLNDLIAGHVLEVVPPEKIHEWISKGLLSDEQDAARLTQLANIVLRHDCTPRCQKRVKSEGGEDDTKCRKLNSVRDTPDPTQDCFVPIECKWGGNTKELSTGKDWDIQFREQ